MKGKRAEGLPQDQTALPTEYVIQSCFGDSSAPLKQHKEGQITHGLGGIHHHSVETAASHPYSERHNKRSLVLILLRVKSLRLTIILLSMDLC